MPGGDRTGPAGIGPMTGRGAGFCAGFGVPGYANSAGGSGFGMGWGRGGRLGRGRGFGRGFGWAGTGYGMPAYGGVPYGPDMPTVTSQQELAGLKEQSQFLQKTLTEITNRIEELEKAEQGK